MRVTPCGLRTCTEGHHRRGGVARDGANVGVGGIQATQGPLVSGDGLMLTQVRSMGAVESVLHA